MNPLESFHPVVRRWFSESFEAPTRAQELAWPAIARGEHTLLLAPTGSGKTLAAFLAAIDRILFAGDIAKDDTSAAGVRVLYISPLKALGVDVERNLRAPIAGVRAVAEREGIAHRTPTVAVRSGDTPAADRYRLTREPPDILITTPESLYLMLTSRARGILTTVDTVIVDEIHSLVASKRGAHLFVSLERLEALRGERGTGEDAIEPMQRIGLSATQRPLDEIARLLGGATATSDANVPPVPRPVTILEAGRSRELELRIEVPVEDMARLGLDSDGKDEDASGPASGEVVPSIWPSIYPRLVEEIRAHRSTLVFTNSRRLAERLANAINEEADEEIARAHHGSIARDARLEIEDRLKRGLLPALVATSSLELGIDMGAVDQVIQVEAPPTIASGIQRIGRSSHHVGGTSSGVIFPKFRGDLLACAAAAARIKSGDVEETRYARNPLDVLAQQIVAIVALGPIRDDAIYAIVRRAAPFHELPRASFDGVLDMLAGRYPSDEFAGLRARVTWDRVAGEVLPRRGTQRVAILNGGTIPDRGLYGVYLAGEDGESGSRVGELDEEMVFETRPGDVFLLGASSWRALDITHDRVIVAPAPGEPGRMPFWRGDGPGRPIEFGRAIGAFVRRMVRAPRDRATAELVETHGLDARAAANLLDYLHEQREATRVEPSDKTIVIESFVDEVGDWRVAVLTPFGARVHAPWATAVATRLRETITGEVDLMWTDDGMAFRLPESDEPPSSDLFFPKADEVEDIVVGELGQTAMFAARFRENAARALLLPRRAPGRRTPLWLQRRKSSDLLAVAARYRSFPILLETYRECLRDVFDLPSLKQLLRDVETRAIRVHAIETRTPSPFAAALLFNYTAQFLYNADTPLSERRAQTLALDLTQLRELLGDADFRELLVADVIDEVALELQRLDGKHPVRDADEVHDRLREFGDLTRDEIAARCEADSVADGSLDTWLAQLVERRRVVSVRIANESRYVAAEDAARYRDGLGVVLPPGLPEAFLDRADAALIDLVAGYARTHAPFRVDDVATRLGLGTSPVTDALGRLAEAGRVIEGEITPGRRGREWCDTGVLQRLKQRSLARLRKQVAPVATSRLASFLIDWQGIERPRRGLDGLLDGIEQLQGAPLPFSALERDILPARVADFRPSDLDELAAAGEIIWRGVESIGTHDARVALYLTDSYAKLAPAPNEVESDAEADGNRDSGVALTDADVRVRLRAYLAERGASFFDDIVAALGVFRDDVFAALWELVLAGEVTNDTFAPLRARLGEGRGSRGMRGRRSDRGSRRGDRGVHRFRSRRAPRMPGSEGRWSLLPAVESLAPATERAAALATQLVERYGILTREMVLAEGIAGGFAQLYPVLRAMEEAGKIRRGYFVAGLGAAQFAAAGADDRLRDEPVEVEPPKNSNDPQDFPDSDDALGFDEPSDGQDAFDSQSTIPNLAATHVLGATDPANPYGASLRWPESDADARPQRVAGARVVLDAGELVGYVGRTGNRLMTFLPEDEAKREKVRRRLAHALAALARARRPVYLTSIDGAACEESELREDLEAAGFSFTGRGCQHRGGDRRGVSDDARR